MKIKSAIWSIKRLVSQRQNINPKPQYQRTSVWSPAKKKLLIDSILRGYDIPKFYLNETPNSKLYRWEVTDGQQRMHAIWEFTSADKALNFALNEAEIDGVNIKGLKYDDLENGDGKKLLNRLLNFKLHFSIIKQSTPEEIRSLFARLQMGERLNQAELRHAIASNIGNVIFSLTENHSFFNECKIPNNRYKHQDYLDHAFTLAYFNLQKNLKAIDLRSLYVELANETIGKLQPLSKSIQKVLDYMERINNQKKGIFKNKWGFIDSFYLIYKNLDKIQDVKPKNFADSFTAFESRRKLNNAAPEKLIEDKNSPNYDKDLYDYIIAFNTYGADKTNITIRSGVFNKLFFTSENFTLK